jgi:hypothetical protein
MSRVEYQWRPWRRCFRCGRTRASDRAGGGRLGRPMKIKGGRRRFAGVWGRFRVMDRSRGCLGGPYIRQRAALTIGSQLAFLIRGPTGTGSESRKRPAANCRPTSRRSVVEPATAHSPRSLDVSVRLLQSELGRSEVVDVGQWAQVRRLFFERGLQESVSQHAACATTVAAEAQPCSAARRTRTWARAVWASTLPPAGRGDVGQPVACVRSRAPSPGSFWSARSQASETRQHACCVRTCAPRALTNCSAVGRRSQTRVRRTSTGPSARSVIRKRIVRPAPTARRRAVQHELLPGEGAGVVDDLARRAGPSLNGASQLGVELTEQVGLVAEKLRAAVFGTASRGRSRARSRVCGLGPPACAVRVAVSRKLARSRLGATSPFPAPDSHQEPGISAAS